jgi:hypothetical protein
MQPPDLEAWLEQLGKTREISIPPEFRAHIEAIIVSQLFYGVIPGAASQRLGPLVRMTASPGVVTP